MTLYTAGNPNSGQISQLSINLFLSIRNTFLEVQNLYNWMSGQEQGDLEGLGFSAGDLSLLQSALADANALADIYSTGLPPGTYPQPSTAYTYANSMRIVMGPQ